MAITVTSVLRKTRPSLTVEIACVAGVPGIAGPRAPIEPGSDLPDDKLRKLKEAAGRGFAGGVVLYDGETTASFGDGLFAVPIWALWETTA